MKLVKRLISRTKYYFDNTGIHGLRYITEPGRHFTERFFWSGVCSLAVYATYNLLVATWYNFQHNAVNFGVETSYLEWNTTFPSITVCEHEAPDKIFESGSSLYGEDRNMNLDFFVRDIAFFDGTCVSCSVHCDITVNCSDNFDKIVNNEETTGRLIELLISRHNQPSHNLSVPKVHFPGRILDGTAIMAGLQEPKHRLVRAPCEDFLGDCTWNGAAFNCCLHFLPLHTELGTCYSLNSLHTSPQEGVEKLALISNRKTGPGKLDFTIYEATKLFIHSTEEVPTLNHPQEEKVILNWGVYLAMVIHVVEIENDPLLEQVSVEQRNCRFPHENNLPTYEHYSYSACIADCRTAMGIQYCNCTNHFVAKFPGVKVCDVAGLACISNHAEMLRSLKPKGSPKKGLECDCMSSCSEPEYTVISKNSDQEENSESTKVSVAMDALPSHRFKRNVVRTKLDLVVSMGGTAGLFLGASILSTAEWVYYMFIRKRKIPNVEEDPSNAAKQPDNATVASVKIGGSSGIPLKHKGREVIM